MTESGAGRQVSFHHVGEDEAGQRIDNFLVARLKGVPKSRVYRILRKGEVRVNKGRVKPEYRLRAGDSVRIPPLRLADRAPSAAPGAALRERLAAGILYESEDLLVADKPAGLAVHGGSGVDLGMIEALRAMRPEQSLELVHRLDRGTSGCLLVAKKRSALRDLQAQLREHRVEKVYLALVDGQWPKGLAEMDAPLEKRTAADGGKIVRPHKEGKRALTRFRALRRWPDMTLLEVTLETGRTHQIRVHCQLAGHPLLGDDKYGRDDRNRALRQRGLKRLFLHAHRLCFNLPGGGDRLCVESPLPQDLKDVIDP